MIAAWYGESVLPTKPELGAIGFLLVIKKVGFLLGPLNPAPELNYRPSLKKTSSGYQVYWLIG